MANDNDLFTEAGTQWDLETLYTDLASAKGKRLTPIEKLHLRALLCGLSPSEIATKLQKDPRGVDADLCATVYKYVKSLLGKSETKIGTWQNISEWLNEAGYKIKSGAQLPLDGLKGNVNITNITINNIDNQNLLTIGMSLQLNVPIPPEVTPEGLQVEYNNNTPK